MLGSLRPCLHVIRDVVLCVKVPKEDEPTINSIEGPAVFDRILAAHRLGRLLRMLPHPVLSEALRETQAMVFLLSVLEDPSPKVQFRGFRTLEHVGREATASDLRQVPRVGGRLVVLGGASPCIPGPWPLQAVRRGPDPQVYAFAVCL